MSTPLAPAAGTYVLPPLDAEARAFIARILGCSVCGGGAFMAQGAREWTCPGCGTGWARPAYLDQVKPTPASITAWDMADLEALDAHLRAAITIAEGHRDIELAAKLLPARIEAGREIARRRALAGEPAGEVTPGRGDGTPRC